MKAAFLLLGRDKAPYVEEAARSALDQVTEKPIEILLSDQGSTDGTTEILDRLAHEYNGPHGVRRIDCPHTSERGIPGINAHLTWAVAQTDANVVLVTSADDWNHPTRAQRVIDTFLQTEAMAVSTAIEFWAEDGEKTWTAHPGITGFVDPLQVLAGKVAGSSSMAFDRKLVEAIGDGLAGHVVNDVALGYWAACTTRGYMYLREPLYRYYQRADRKNAGLEGRLRAAKSDAEKEQVLELIDMQLCETYRVMIAKCEEIWGVHWKPEHATPLQQQFYVQCRQWAERRAKMDRMGVKPILYDERMAA